jgi:hypothetical protein
LVVGVPCAFSGAPLIEMHEDLVRSELNASRNTVMRLARPTICHIASRCTRISIWVSRAIVCLCTGTKFTLHRLSTCFFLSVDG